MRVSLNNIVRDSRHALAGGIFGGRFPPSLSSCNLEKPSRNSRNTELIIDNVGELKLEGAPRSQPHCRARQHSTISDTSSINISSLVFDECEDCMAQMSSDDQLLTSYSASCHCGKLNYTVKTPSLSNGHAVMSCNCSICTRNAYLLIYPKHEAVTFQSGYDELISFVFGKNNGLHKFCSTCGNNALAEFPGDDCYCINVGPPFAQNRFCRVYHLITCDPDSNVYESSQNPFETDALQWEG